MSGRDSMQSSLWSRTRPGSVRVAACSDCASVMGRLQDIDPLETREWVDSLDAVLEIEGPDRAHFILEQLVDKARRSGAYLPYCAQTAYINTIPPHMEEHSPGNQELEHRLRSVVRWNAVAMVLRAGKKDLELGGHIASFASAATLYDVCVHHV